MVTKRAILRPKHILGADPTAYLDPASDYSIQWDSTFGSGTGHYDRIARNSGDTNGISTATQGDIDWYTLDDLPGAATSVTSVQLHCRCRSPDGEKAGEDIGLLDRLSDGGTIRDSDQDLPRTNFAWVATVVYTTDPDAAGWTVSKVNGMQIGLEADLLGTGETADVSEFYAEVVYEEFISDSTDYSSTFVVQNIGEATSKGTLVIQKSDEEDLSSKLIVQQSAEVSAPSGTFVVQHSVGIPITLSWRTSADEDDCLVQYNGSEWSLLLWNANQPAGYNTSSTYMRGGGMRWTPDIPQGATIQSAYLKITANASLSEVNVKSRIKGEKTANASQFSDYANYNGRTRTTAVVDWDNIPAWTENTEYTSPAITTVIQEIMDQGFSSGNGMVVFWDDHDNRSDNEDYHTRKGYSYDSDPSKCSKLEVTYIWAPWLTSTLIVQQSDLKDLSSTLTVQQSDEATLSSKLIVQVSDEKDLSSQFIVQQSGLGELSSTFELPIFCSGFETEDDSFTQEWTGKNTTDGETATVVTTDPHHGSKHAEFTTDGSTTWESAYCYKTFTEQSTVYARGYFKIKTSLPASTKYYELIYLRNYDLGWVFRALVRGGATKQWELIARDGAGSETDTSTTPTPTLDTWYCLELYGYVHATAGEAKLYINGTEVCSLSNLDTADYGNIDELRMGECYSSGQTAHIIYLDCVKVDVTYIGPDIFEKSLSSTFVVRQKDSANLSSTFFAYTESKVSTYAENADIFEVVEEGSKDLSSTFDVGVLTGEADLSSTIAIGGVGSSDLSSTFILVNVDTATLSGTFTIQKSDEEDLSSQFIVQHSDLKELSSTFIVQQYASISLSCTFIIQKKDSENLSSVFLIQRSVGILRTKTYQVSADLDDGRCDVAGGNVQHDTLYPFLDTKYNGLRWQVDIPDGATINSAYLKLCAEDTGAQNYSTRIQVYDQDNCDDFDADFSGWGVMSDYVDWAPDGGWTAGTWYTSGDLKVMVQAYIDRSGYNPNNYLGMRLHGSSDSGFRQAYQHEGDSTKAAKLEVTYMWAPWLSSVFTAQQSDLKKLSSTFFLYQVDTEDLSGTFEIQKSSSADLSSIFIIQQSDEKDLSSTFVIQKSDEATVSSTFIVQQYGSIDLSSTFIVRNVGEKDFSSTLVIGGVGEADLSATCVVQNIGSQDLSSTFDIQKEDLAELSSTFVVAQSAEADLSSTFVVQQYATVDFSSAFVVQQEGEADLSSTFTIQKSDLAELSGTFTIQKSAEATLSGTFVIQKAESSDLSSQFTLQKSDLFELSSTFVIQKSAYSELSSTIFIFQSDFADLSSTIEIINKAYSDLFSTVTIGGVGTATLSSTFEVINVGVADLSSTYTIQKVDAKPLSSTFEVAQSAEATLSATFIIQQVGIEDLSSTFILQNEGYIDVSSRFVIQKSDLKELSSTFSIQQAAEATLSATFEIQKADYADVSSRFIIQKEESIQLSCTFVIQQIASIGLPSTFEAIKFASKTLSATFIVQKVATKNLSSTFEVQWFEASTTLSGTFEIPYVLTYMDLQSVFNVAAAKVKLELINFPTIALLMYDQLTVSVTLYDKGRP